MNFNDMVKAQRNNALKKTPILLDDEFYGKWYDLPDTITLFEDSSDPMTMRLVDGRYAGQNTYECVDDDITLEFSINISLPDRDKIANYLVEYVVWYGNPTVVEELDNHTNELPKSHFGVHNASIDELIQSVNRDIGEVNRRCRQFVEKIDAMYEAFSEYSLPSDEAMHYSLGFSMYSNDDREITFTLVPEIMKDGYVLYKGNSFISKVRSPQEALEIAGHMRD